MSEKLLDDIRKDPELESLLRLHETINKVKKKNFENHDKIEKLDVAFKALQSSIQTLSSEQQKSVSDPDNTKKKDHKKK